MTNADKFKSIFGLYATELWAKHEKDFLEWLNADAELFGNSEQLAKDINVPAKDCISRRAAIDAVEGVTWYRAEDIYHVLDTMPSEQIDCSYCIANGGDWECDHIHCHIGQSPPSAQPDHIGEVTEMVGDVISRQAAIDVIEAGRLTKLIDAETAVNGLKVLPSAQPEQRWIPVTPETEPKENGEYLVTRESKGLYRYIDIVKKSNVTDKMASDIVAYMPLPEPWKGEDVE